MCVTRRARSHTAEVDTRVPALLLTVTAPCGAPLEETVTVLVVYPPRVPAGPLVPRTSVVGAATSDIFAGV